MIEIINERECVARKDHLDDLYEYIQEWMCNSRLRGCSNISEYRIILNYLKKEKPYIIKKGELYTRQFLTNKEICYSFKFRKEIFNIFLKYNNFDDF